MEGFKFSGKPAEETRKRESIWWAITRLYDEVLGERGRTSPRKRGSARKGGDS